MKTYITSDLHFYHKNIAKYSPKYRGHFTSVEEMNEYMISEWNKTVQYGDLVYILGDVAFTNVENAVKIMNRLNGNKILIRGNHDAKLLKDEKFRACFQRIYDYHVADIDGKKVVMFHYPILEWDRMHHGVVHFHGHLHGNPTGLEQYRIRDVGFDATGRVVSDIHVMIAEAEKGEIRAHHGEFNT